MRSRPHPLRGLRSFRALRKISALLLCLVFTALELSASAPGLHRHNEGLDGLFCSRACAAGATVAVPDGHQDQAPRECPACTISGLFAIASPGVPVWAPATRVQNTPPDPVRDLSSPFVASVRGRAPPSAS
jgi:hypothetical protein